MTTNQKNMKLPIIESFGKEDNFNRKPIANNIIKLLKELKFINLIAIDGRWGTGKTVFVKKLKNLIESTHANLFNCVFINAQQSERIDDPLIPLMSAIINKFGKQDNTELLKEKLIALSKFGLKATGRGVIAWLLRTSGDKLSEEIKDAIQETTDNFTNYCVDELINQEIEANRNIDSLKKILAKLTLEKELIIFIDELDRCKPNYALNILEVIKQIFDIPQVKIIYAVNMEQMKAAIKHKYGYEINSQLYFDKYIDIIFRLPNICHSNNLSVNVKHFKDLLPNYIEDKKISDNCKLFLQRLIKHSELSLREVESLLKHIKIYECLKGKIFIEEKKNPVILRLEIIAIFIYYLKPEIKNKILNKNIHTEEITSLFGEYSYPNRDHSNIDIHIPPLTAFFANELNDNNFPGYAIASKSEKEYWISYYQHDLIQYNAKNTTFFNFFKKQFEAIERISIL